MDLMQIFEGYVRNYRRLNLSLLHNRSMFTKREIEYFANLGEMLGYFSFVEDSKPDKVKGRSRPMDLSWWKWDQRKSDEEFQYLALHLERENSWNKDEDTIEKLFSNTEDGYVPRVAIGIQNIEGISRIEYLNQLVVQKNRKQKSDVLMVYRFYDKEKDFDRIWGFVFNQQGLIEERKVICDVDRTGYWVMCFEEEY